MTLEGIPPEEPTDKIDFENGIAGVYGFQGDFRPVTTADGVTIVTDEFGQTHVESEIPNHIAEPSPAEIEELFADNPDLLNRLQVMQAIRRAVARYKKRTGEEQ